MTKIKYNTLYVVLAISIFIPASFLWGGDLKKIKLTPKNPDSGFTYPSIEAKGIIKDIFEFSEAEWISGLSCKIKYNGKRPLPSKVFFSIYDSRGKEIAHRIRLIYPNLESGQTGTATFRNSNGATLIVIWAEGDGPWESPY